MLQNYVIKFMIVMKINTLKNILRFLFIKFPSLFVEWQHSQIDFFHRNYNCVAITFQKKKG